MKPSLTDLPRRPHALRLLPCLIAGFLGLSPWWAAAQIRIGQPSGFTGAVAAGVKESTEGARLVFDAVNRKGGVHGQRIELLSVDDGFVPERTLTLARQLVDDGVIALFLTRGTPNNEALLPLLKAQGVPLVGPSSGAMSLHKPVHPWVFNVRSSYQGETRRVVEHLHLSGMSRLAIVQVEDSFGADAVQGAILALSAKGETPVSWQKYKREKPEFTSLMPALNKADPQAVLFIGSAAHVAEGIHALRASGSHAQAFTLSNNASSGFVKALGDQGRGVVVTQVFPSERQTRHAFVREALALVAPLPGMVLSQATLEGMAAARVLVEGLRLAGKNPTRESLRQALEGMRLDLGGLEIAYSPKDHTGASLVDIAIIDRDGHFQR